MADFVDRSQAHDRRVETLIAEFEREYRRRPEGIAEAPGRVNLIGEHVDYNDGLVLPFAIDRSVLVAWACRDDDAVWAQSADFDERSRFNISHVTPAAPGSWANYVRGVADVLGRGGHVTDGLDLSIAGNIPQGAGLSSSAAIEVAAAGAFRDAFDIPIDNIALAQLCQRAENEYVGVQCGIMDQFASALSVRDHALLIDCRSLAHEAVPLRLDAAGLTIVIANSAVGRELVSSAYNDRRRECEEAVSDLRVRLVRPELASLRDVAEGDLRRLAIDSVPMRRARHVVTEIARVAAAADALSRDDFAALGSLMVESHISLRDDYEVSSKELDLLVGLATGQDYVLGARLTGAGFGGCTVNLVRTDAIDAFSRDVIAPYRERTGLPAVMYVTSPQDGLRTWRL
jgi:galactokinase